MSVLEKFATFLLISSITTLILASTQDDHEYRMASSIFWGVIIGFASTILIIL